MREHTDGDFPFANEFNAVIQALNGTAVLSGCAVTDGGTNDMAVDVSAGTVAVAGTECSVPATQIDLAGSDPDDDRYDLVVVGTDGTVEAVTGTASSMPIAPSIPADHVLLAVVGVSASTTGISDTDIVGARAILSDVPVSALVQGSGSGLDADTVDGQHASILEGAKNLYPVTKSISTSASGESDSSTNTYSTPSDENWLVTHVKGGDGTDDWADMSWTVAYEDGHTESGGGGERWLGYQDYVDEFSVTVTTYSGNSGTETGSLHVHGLKEDV